MTEDWISVHERLPNHDDLVWIHENFYHGVTLGYLLLGCNRYWCHYNGSDDIHVTHWKPIEYPPKPIDILRS